MNKIHFLPAMLLLLLMACSPQRDLVYFSNLSDLSKSQIQLNESDLRIQKNDILNISVKSMNPELNAFYALNIEKSIQDNRQNNTIAGIKVNQDGTIELLGIGRLKVEGLKIEEARKLIEKTANVSADSSMVDVQLVNFKITVIGEVNKPASFTVSGEKINLLEALGMAGDMTVYGKRENVLVIRETNGQRDMVRLNLNKQDVFQSPYFHLKQNDVVYVEPDKSKEKEYSPNNRALPIITACISAVAVLATALIR